MGTSANVIEVNFRANGVSAVQSGIRAVRDEARAAGQATRNFGEGSIFGIAELSRGLSRVAETGTASTMAMRELAGGVMRLGSSLGPGAGLVGILLLLGGTIAEVFMHAREEMKKTVEEFEAGVAKMANTADSTGLQKSLRDLYFGTPYDSKNQLVTPSATPGAFTGSLVDLRNRKAFLDSQLAHPQGQNLLEQSVFATKIQDALKALTPQLDAAEKKWTQLTTALGVIQSQPGSMNLAGAVPGMKITARGTYAGPDEFSEGDARFLAALAKGPMAEEMRQLRLPLLRTNAYQTPGTQVGGPLNTPLIGGGSLLDPFSGKAGFDKIPAPKVARIIKTAYDQIAEESAKQLQSLGERLSNQFASTFGGAIATGFKSAFSSGSIGEGFASAGKAMLSGLGSIFVEMGEQALAGLALIQTIKTAITSFMPEIGIPAAVGLIALGSLLEAAGSGASHSVAHYGSSGGASYGAMANSPSYVGPGGMPNTSGITPAAPVHFTIFGKNDPEAQRGFLEMYVQASRRGTTAG